MRKLTNFERKNDLNQMKGNSISIHSCFQASNIPETLDKHNLWYCSFCKTHVQATKLMEIYKVPKILIIQLKRFKTLGFHKEKINAPIEFPRENFDISQYVIGHKPELYDLYAVSNHFGTLSGGHYTATVLSGGKWYECDDSHVSEAKDISETSAYVLFYRSKNDSAF